MARLFTAHDPHHIHKGLGAFACLHFAFRLGRLLCQGDAFPPNPGPWDYAGVALHLALSLSSYITPVPSKRNLGAPLIWPEGRAHSLFFSGRHVVATLLALAARGGPDAFPVAARVVLTTVLTTATAALADAATAAMGSRDARTTASMAYPPELDAETVSRTKRFYSAAQFGATCLCGTWHPTFAFVPLYAIQLAPFLMTLVRKGKLGARGWHLGYYLALLVGYVAGLAVRPHALWLKFGTASTAAGYLRRERGWPRYTTSVAAAALAGIAGDRGEGWAGEAIEWGGGTAAGLALATKVPLLLLHSVPPHWAAEGSRWGTLLEFCRWAHRPTPALFVGACALRLAWRLCSE